MSSLWGAWVYKLHKVGYMIPEPWAEEGPGQLLRLLTLPPRLGVGPPTTVRIRDRWLGEGQDWPLPRVGGLS